MSPREQRGIPLDPISPLLTSNYDSYRKMPDVDSHLPKRSGKSRKKRTLLLVASYVSDWVILIVAGVVGLILGNITPNKRPFYLTDPNISFPFTVHETVPSWLLLVCNAVIPIVVILVVALVFVPGPTAPKGTPQSLIWKRKLWELHTGWLGLALSLASAWFITSGMKNLFGKPRPDLLARCEPDIANLADYVVGGLVDRAGSGQLVSANICKSTDKDTLDDGFRSYPSGHASSAAAGLIYLSLFLASKFSVTFPFAPPAGYSDDATSHTAFPSRLRNKSSNNNNNNNNNNSHSASAYSPVHTAANDPEDLSSPGDQAVHKRIASHNEVVLSVRRQAAAPPIYLLVIIVLPFFLAIFIAASRWFNFRHHGFDILFGFIIGTVTAFFAFRYYHMPIRNGAGWAWGPRSPDKAFWAGIGTYSYATDKRQYTRPGDETEALGSVHMDDLEAGTGGRKTTNCGSSTSGADL